MKSTSKLHAIVNKRLESNTLAPHQASELGFQIFLLLHDDDTEIKSSTGIAENFRNKIIHWKLSDLLTHQIEYAMRLATSDGQLLYEEMHKLFSLLDEIYALKCIGLKVDDEIETDLSIAIQARLKREPKKYKQVAHDKFQDWKKSLWWYRLL